MYKVDIIVICILQYLQYWGIKAFPKDSLQIWDQGRV